MQPDLRCRAAAIAPRLLHFALQLGMSSVQPTRPRSSGGAAKARSMSIGTILLIILVIALLGGFSGIGGGPFYGTGYYGGGGLGLILVVVLILVLMGRI